MSDNIPPASPPRRGLSRRVLIGAVPLAAVSVAVPQSAAEASETPSDPNIVAYTETAHIRAFYDRLRY